MLRPLLSLRQIARLACITVAAATAASASPNPPQRPCSGTLAPPVASTAAFRIDEEAAFEVNGDHAIAVTAVLNFPRSIVLYDRVDGAWTEANRFPIAATFDIAWSVTAAIKDDVAIVCFGNLFGGGPDGTILFTMQRDGDTWLAPVPLELPPFVSGLELDVVVQVSGNDVLVSNLGGGSVLVYSKIGGEYRFVRELLHQTPTLRHMAATDTRMLLASNAGQYEVWTRPTPTATFAPFATGTLLGAPLLPDSIAIDDGVFAWQSNGLIRLLEFDVERQEQPVEVLPLLLQDVPLANQSSRFRGVRVAGGHVVALVRDNQGGFGQLAVGSRLDFLDRWVWDGRLDVTLNYDLASLLAFDGETAAILFKNFAIARAHFVSVLSPDQDCDANCVPDVEQIANAGGAVDRNDNQRLDSCEEVGSVYCAPAVVNSTGASAVLRIVGAPRPLSPDLLAVGQRMPPGSIALLVSSAQAGYVPMVGGGAGTLCLGSNQFGRFVDQLRPVGADGIAMVSIATDQIPTSGGSVALTPGDTWFFQFWFRDQGASSNLSDASALIIE